MSNIQAKNVQGTAKLGSILQMGGKRAKLGQFIFNELFFQLTTLSIAFWQNCKNIMAWEMQFSNTLIIDQIKTKKITAIREVSIPGLN